MTPTELKKIEEVTKEFFQKTGLDVQVQIKSHQDSTLPIVLTMEEPQVLIGERGQTLIELQRLLKIILRRQVSQESPFYVDVDINDYKKKKSEYLREMARTTADEVALTKKEKYLPVMAAYERRIIHVELASRIDVVTESDGQEPERRVMIKSRP